MQIITIPVGLLRTNCYLVFDEMSRRGFAVDPGGYPERILAQIEAHRVQLEAILLTHGHFDHITAVPEVVAASGAKVYAAEAELPILEQPQQMPRGVKSITLSPDVTLHDGDEISVAGVTIHCMSTPGHTKGGLCYQMGDVLFTGDTLFAGTCGRCDFPGGDYAEMLASLKRLAELPGEFRVLPGHEEETTLSRERATNPYVVEACRV